MFTGIITAVGAIHEVAAVDGGRELVIATSWDDVVTGESIAVDGACLTVMRVEAAGFRVHVVTTSLDRTRIGEYQAGTRVNLERAVRAGDRLGGHLVQGHVDGVGTVVSVRQAADARLLDIQVPSEVAAVSIPLGSIAVDGVSLTVNALPASGDRPGLAHPVYLGSTPRWARSARVIACTSREITWGSTSGSSCRPTCPSGGVMTSTPIEQAIADLRAGRMVVVVDDEDRENEGDLVWRPSMVTADAINFMMRARPRVDLPDAHSRGMRPPRLAADGGAATPSEQRPPSPSRSTPPGDSASPPGISAADRATTIRVAIDPATSPADLRRPGHISPLRARPRGVLQRVGHTEASVDLARLAGLRPAGRDLRDPRMPMARWRASRLERFANEHGLALVSVADLAGLPAPHRAAGAPDRRGAAADRVRRVPGDRLPQRRRPRRACRAGLWRGPGRNATCWYGCTPSASPATSSIRCGVTAASSCTAPWS